MKNKSKRKGMTLMELAVTILLTAITILVIGVVMLDSHRGWLDAYAKVHGGAADDAAMIQAAFEKIVRKASSSKYLLNGLDDLTVFYYQDWQSSAWLDRYARFYRAEENPSEFYIEHGTVDEDGDTAVVSTIQACTNVTDAEFKPTSGGIEMKIRLDDGRETTTALTTAILHNE